MHRLFSYYSGVVGTGYLEKFRIAVCAAVLVHYLSYLPHIPLLLSSSPEHAANFPFLARHASPLFYLLLLTGFASTAGFFTRSSLIAHLTLHTYFAYAGIYKVGSWGLFYSFCLIFLIASRSVSRWSADYYLFPKSRAAFTPLWPLRWLQMQVSLMYLVVISLRYENTTWQKGEALQKMLEYRMLSRLSAFDLDSFSPLLVALSHAHFLIELAGAGLIFYGKKARYVASVLIFMHLTLQFTFMLGPWQILVISALSTFFIPQHAAKSGERKRIALALASLTLVSYAFALPPSYWKAPWFRKPYAQARSLLTDSRIAKGLDFHMMSNEAVHSSCAFVTELQGEAIKRILYATDKELCQGDSIYMLADPVLNFLIGKLVSLRFEKEKAETGELPIFNHRRSLRRSTSYAFCSSSNPMPEAIGITIITRKNKDSAEIVSRSFAVKCEGLVVIEKPESLIEFTKERQREMSESAARQLGR